MSSDPITGKVKFHYGSDQEPLEFESVLSFKYLGIHIAIKPYMFFRDFNKRMQDKALKYPQTILDPTSHIIHVFYGDVLLYLPLLMVLILYLLRRVLLLQFRKHKMQLENFYYRYRTPQPMLLFQLMLA